jgi:integrase
MARPPLPLGTHGRIRIYRTTTGYKACTLVRDYDGRTRQVGRHAATKSAAEIALKMAVRDRGRVGTYAEITPETKVGDVAESWWAALTDLAPSTMQGYRDRLDNQVIPGLGGLRIRELSTGTVHRHLREVELRNGPSMAKMTRTVLSGLCGWAVRQDAIDRNPVREAGAVRPTTRRPPRSLTAPQVRQLRALLTYDDRAVARDVIDLVGVLAATGMRIGEATALLWDDVDLEAGTVDVGATIVRVKGKGAIRQAFTKSQAGKRMLQVPAWCVSVLDERERTEDLVFPAVRGGVRDPSNIQADLRDAFANAGFPWVTSHTLRKTVATLMDQAGLSARAAADQLGHAKPSMTQDNYMGRRIAVTGAAQVLDDLEVA